MYTKFLPNAQMDRLLRKKSKLIHSALPTHNHSMWFYDREKSTVTICTTCPGIWIGYHGQDVYQLKEELSGLAGQKINVAFIECSR